MTVMKVLFWKRKYIILLLLVIGLLLLAASVLLNAVSVHNSHWNRLRDKLSNKSPAEIAKAEENRLRLHFAEMFEKSRPFHKFIEMSHKAIAVANRQIAANYSDEKERNVVIISGAAKLRNFSSYSRKRLKKYCKLHGYKLIYFDKPIDPLYTPWWQKIVAVKNVLTGLPFAQFNPNELDHIDIIAWMDDDTFVTNLTTKLENFFQLRGNLGIEPEFIITVDTENQPFMLLNSGVFLLKNTPAMRDYFIQVLAKFDEIPHFQVHPFHDQSALILTYFESLYNRTLLLPMCILQSFDSIWMKGDFIMHISGLNGEYKMKMMEWIATRKEPEWIAYPRSWSPGQCVGPRRPHWEY